MPTNKAITRQESAAWLVPLTTDASNQVTGKGTEIPFDYVEGSGPTWPAPEGASNTEFIETVIASGITVQFPKETKTFDGVTATEKTTSASTSHKLKFTILEWGKTLATTLPPLQGKMVLACIPIGRNITTSERGWYYIAGKFSSEISYDAKGDTVVSVTIEVTGASFTASAAGDTALAWAPAAITPIGGTALTPTPLVTGDLTALKAGQIVVK